MYIYSTSLPTNLAARVEYEQHMELNGVDENRSVETYPEIPANINNNVLMPISNNSLSSKSILYIYVYIVNIILYFFLLIIY